MANQPLSAAPQDPYQWRESVLSTRSLSYLSNADAIQFASAGQPQSSHVRSNSLTRPLTQQSTATTEESDCGLEMGQNTSDNDERIRDRTGLPRCVARSLLFKLPRELRDRIYIFCLTARNGSPVDWPTRWKPYHMQPQLLRTCSVIYNEAARYLYTLNNLTFHHPSDVNMFVRAFAPPALVLQITTLSLNIKAQDTRLWMPYIMSRFPTRSLRMDFPSLQLLNIRFRSNKWHNAITPEANIKLCCDDSRLVEVIDGLNNAFARPDTVKGGGGGGVGGTVGMNAAACPCNHRICRNSRVCLRPGELEPREPGSTSATTTYSRPTIKLVCACRTNAAHFTQLTEGAIVPSPPPTTAGQILGLAIGVLPSALAAAAESSPAPVREGEPFRSFSAIDLRHSARSLHDPDLGSANVARTPFANKNGVLLSLEIHCLGPMVLGPDAGAAG